MIALRGAALGDGAGTGLLFAVASATVLARLAPTSKKAFITSATPCVMGSVSFRTLFSAWSSVLAEFILCLLKSKDVPDERLAGDKVLLQDMAEAWPLWPQSNESRTGCDHPS